MREPVFSLKDQREQFKETGKFHTPPELAEWMRSLLPDPNPLSVYDPTCGAGGLLAVFPDSTAKYGQDIDEEAVEYARQTIPNFLGVVGDVLTEPALTSTRFPAIVANPPFSVKWTPNKADWRFADAPTVPTKSRADYAFLLHIMAMLTDDGTAVVLQAPGVLYRGGREGQLREWMVRQGWVREIVSVPGGTFADTSIATVALVFRKGDWDGTIRFTEKTGDRAHVATLAEIEENEFGLSPNTYLPPELEETEEINAHELALQITESAIENLLGTLRVQQVVCALEGWDFEVFRRRVVDAVNSFGNGVGGEE